jgi:hypothetical protein
VRWTASFLLVASMATSAVPTVLAVHDTGAFELDGNATNDPAVPGDDWDNVCHQVSPTDCPTPAGTSGATATSWVAELNPNATVFTGGGSKDPQDISNWAWKDGAGGIPDKDNLLHAFAARYSQSPSASCPSGGAATCEVLYFGSDRLDNSGDAQQGFWFLQNRISLGSTSSGGGFTFNGVHKNGDLLIISDFSNGGGTSTISVYRWNTAVSGNLELLETSSSANCATAGAGDAFCGITNGANGTPAPWAFTDKSGNHTYLQGELFEAGVNLSLIGLGNECFSSLVAETRSSTSTTATLKDFVVGNFAVCSASMNTTPSSTSFTVGGSLTDSATITVIGGSVPPAPTGTVDFFVCGPSATTCDSSGTKFSTVNLSTATVNGNNYTVTSGSLTPNSAGTYCFFANWAGDNNYVGGASHNGPNECFTVSSKQPAISTSQTTGPLPLGSSISDSATLTGTAARPNGTPAGGSITFTLFGPQATPASPVCTGTPVFTSSAVTVSGDGTYGPVTFTPTAPGQYNWVATYSGDLPNTLGVASGCADEPSLLIALQPSMTTAQSYYPNDSATLTVASGAGNLAGNVRFRLFTAADCSGSAIVDQTVAVSGASPQQVGTSNTTVKVDTTQHNLSWLVEFTSTNLGIKNVTSTCHNENSDLSIDNGVASNTP